MTIRRFRGPALALLVWSIAAAAHAAAPDGQALYAQQCARCHGASGRGDGPDAALFVKRPTDLRTGFLAEHSTADVVRRVLDGRLELDAPALRAHANDVEGVVAYLQRLPDVDWHAADAGELLFASRCTPCHGVFGKPAPAAALPPGVRSPRDLSDGTLQRATSDVDLEVAVRHGRAGMPALTPRLGEAETRQVVAYVRLLSPGYVTYATYCAACHGDHGIGAGSFAESVPAPPVVFDRAYFAHHDDEALRGAVWHMLEQHRPSMPHVRGSLTEAQVRAIIEYLKKRQSEQ
jgi:mono/diheme cytochrome c family protein